MPGQSFSKHLQSNGQVLRPLYAAIALYFVWSALACVAFAQEPADESSATEPPPAIKPTEDDSRRPHRLKYRVDSVAVDLGVGLWAWPLPMDWDRDGDLDLIVSCPDVPFNGFYLFENPGDAGSMPVFRPPVFIGPAQRNATLSVVAGEPRVLIPGKELIDFRDNQFSKQETIYPRNNIHNNRVRANQWRYVDYDGDDALDLIVGVGDWTDYGWDNAFNAEGDWTNGPLRGFVYLIRNNGSTNSPDYADPIRLKVGDTPIEVYGMPSPNFADFDRDGDLDLLCGEFLDGFTYFENIGSRAESRYATGRRLMLGDQPLHMDLQMIVPVAIDWDRDGDTDLICGDEDGRVAFIENSGQTAGTLPQFLAPRYFQQEAEYVKCGALATPTSVDWDDDGDEDLICGNSAGYIALIENLGGKGLPQWAPPVRLQVEGKPIRLQAGGQGSIQGPCEAKWGYTTLSAADWDHDGLCDLVVNSIWGKVQWYRNVGRKGQPQLAAAQAVRVKWPSDTGPPKPAWVWWKPKADELVTQWRTTPVVIDLDNDGLHDLVMLDHQGYLAFFRRKRIDDQLWLEPGKRIFTDSLARPLKLSNGDAGRSGRRKFCFTDWDGDGQLDLLVNSKSINLLRNVSTPQRPWAFMDEGPIDQRHLAGHTTSPAIVDWNRDGNPDLLTGAEDGHFYFQPHDWLSPEERETEDLIVHSRHVAYGTLDNGEQSFNNRNYVWFDVPQELVGWDFTRTAGGEPAFVSVFAKNETKIYMAVSRSREGLGLSEWTEVADWGFGYTDSNRAQMDVLSRSLQAGDRIALPQGTWSGSLLLLPPATE